MQELFVDYVMKDDEVEVPVAVVTLTRTGLETRVHVGSTGYKGGKYSYGGRTFIKIENYAGAMNCKVSLQDDFDSGSLDNVRVIELMLAGDWELTTIYHAFKFVVAALEQIEPGVKESDVVVADKWGKAIDYERN